MDAGDRPEQSMSRVLVPLRRRVDAGGDPILRRAGLRVLDGAERVVRKLEAVATTLETAARLEVDLLRRLGPVVDDLGELVRHTLDEARERRRVRERRSDDEVIDVVARPADPG